VCNFGTTYATSMIFHSSTRLQCISPPGMGISRIDIAFNGQNYIRALRIFEIHYKGGAQLSVITPSLGPSSVQFHVTVFGRNFAAQDKCIFESCDGAITDVSMTSASVIVCQTPQRCFAGQSRVGVAVDGGEIVMGSFSLHFRENPKVYSLFPTLGSTVGGTEVHIVGDSFFTSTYSCIFNKTLVQARLLSTSIISCLTPAATHSSSQMIRLQISIIGVFDDISFTQFRYEYVPPLICLEVLSYLMNVNRLSKILVKGENFVRSEFLTYTILEEDHVWMHPAKFKSSSEIECQITDQKEFLTKSIGVFLKISNNVVEFADCDKPIYLIDDQTLAIQPSFGPTLGGTQLLMSGTVFLDLDIQHLFCVICGKQSEGNIQIQIQNI
jgi:hypothetical protein